MELTICVVVDDKTLKQLSFTIKSWLKYRPEMANMKWCAIYDTAGVNPTQVGEVLKDISKLEIIKYIAPIGYESQREKMLTAWVLVPPAVVETAWWMKIDTDVYAIEKGNWLQPSWFANDPVWIAPHWGYTKGLNFLNILEEWGDITLSEYPRLNIKAPPDQLRVAHPRMCSFVSFYNTEWTKHAASLIKDYKLPVPSQDTYHWYVAAREKRKTLKIQMKKFGWRV